MMQARLIHAAHTHGVQRILGSSCFTPVCPRGPWPRMRFPRGLLNPQTGPTPLLKMQFLYVDDMVDESVYVMQPPIATYQAHTAQMHSHINLGFGRDISIAALVYAAEQCIGYTGRIVFDSTKPHGAP
jgi:nucleoside-diphosphate-sugar epimerase